MPKAEVPTFSIKNFERFTSIHMHPWSLSHWALTYTVKLGCAWNPSERIVDSVFIHGLQKFLNF